MNRAEAAKSNGAKSNGPKTREGKAISSKNALHFGLNACDVVIPGEDPQEYEALFDELKETWSPADLLEFDLVSEIAAARWRLRRIPRMEQAAYQAALERVRDNSGTGSLSDQELSARVMNDFTNGPEMKQVHRHETRLRRVWEKARFELEALIRDRHLAERHAREKEATDRLRETMNANYAAELAEIQAMQNEPSRRSRPQPWPSHPCLHRRNSARCRTNPRHRPKSEPPDQGFPAGPAIILDKDRQNVMTEAEIQDYLDSNGYPAHIVRACSAGLVRRWAEFVEEVTRGYEYGIEDYRNDLDIRGILSLIGAEDDPTVGAADSRLQELLVNPDIRVWESSGGDPWWDFGYPGNVSGPFRRDLIAEGLWQSAG